MRFLQIGIKCVAESKYSNCYFAVVFFSNDPSDFKTIIEVQGGTFFQAHHDSKPMETDISPLLSGILKTPD